MICEALQVTGPNQFGVNRTNVRDSDGVVVKVAFSSICGTDHRVWDGGLVYYKTGVARYPIITGHEWCGVYESQPVVGMCIIGCGQCGKCIQGDDVCCSDRKEVGVVNKNGAHAKYVVMPEDMLLPIPEVSPKYALVEPLAVCLHALRRVHLDQGMRILISGYGCIGRLCELILRSRGYHLDIYDPRYTKELESHDFDIVIECSGSSDSLSKYLDIRGLTIILFGFEYNVINPSVLASNEIALIGTLGSSRKDFEEAISIMDEIEPGFFDLFSWGKLNEGIRASYERKVVLENSDGFYRNYSSQISVQEVPWEASRQNSG